MSNVNVNKTDSIKLIKNFIQDLSFENPQNINENNNENNSNNYIDCLLYTSPSPRDRG